MATDNHLFSKFGVELEYMIVDAETLDVRPIADRLIHTDGNLRKNDLLKGDYRWSNELVMHVVEFKTSGPVRDLDALAAGFQSQVGDANQQLAAHGCRLLPTAMHPWMDPHSETVLWPHGDQEIYACFHRIFDCRGHGWSNLQSVHLNLPFDGDDEFRRLHSAIRVLLPALPALCASSPLADGKLSHFLDTRLESYRRNCERIPSVTGHVVPERIRSRAEYEQKLLGTMYRDIAPLDPDGILQDEWLNARGAIARFERGTIEIRVLDIQECPLADITCLQFIVWVLEKLVCEQWSTIRDQELPSVMELKSQLMGAIRSAEDTLLEQESFARAFGFSMKDVPTLSQLWWGLWDRYRKEDGVNPESIETLRRILKHGTLARRIRRAVGKQADKARMHEVYGQLANCLSEGSLFLP